MKVIINRDYGGFSVPSEIASAIGCKEWDDSIEIRTNRIFIEWVEKHEFNPMNVLSVVEIPDEATDWKLNEYDGLESIIAVVDGKIVHIG